MQVSGTITCTATNEFGLDTATATVIVHHSKFNLPYVQDIGYVGFELILNNDYTCAYGG